MTSEVIEGTAVEVGLVVADQGMAATGALALAALPDDEFDRRLAALEKGRDRVARIQRAIMVPDVDYGIIPGTGTRPTLLKPGAEKLCQAYSLAADFNPQRTTGDGETVPHLSYLTRCDLHLGSLDGPVVAVGYGSANSWERKHRYRRGERICPECGKAAIIKGKAEYGGGWVCFKKKDGCGATWRDGAPEIEGQSAGDVENPDPFDLDVVLAKMSEKRAFIDATLRATAASGLFTQDMEDLSRPPDPSPVDRETGEVRTEGGQIGIASLGKIAPVDGQLRQTPDGYSVGFVIGEGRGKVQAVATGPQAEPLAAILPTLIGKRVQAFGPVSSESMTVRGAKVPFLRVSLTRLVTPDESIDLTAPLSVAPEPSGEPVEAPSMEAFDMDALDREQGVAS